MSGYKNIVLIFSLVRTAFLSHYKNIVLIFGLFLFLKNCDKAICNYVHTSEFVPNCYKTQQMCERVVSKNRFMLIQCPNRYKTQKMRDKAVDNYLAALKFIPDWFVTRKRLEKLHYAFFTC